VPRPTTPGAVPAADLEAALADALPPLERLAALREVPGRESMKRIRADATAALKAVRRAPALAEVVAVVELMAEQARKPWPKLAIGSIVARAKEVLEALLRLQAAARPSPAPPPKPGATAKGAATGDGQGEGVPTKREMDEVARQVTAFSGRLRQHLKALKAVARGHDLADQFAKDAERFRTRVSDELRRLRGDLDQFQSRRMFDREEEASRRFQQAAPRRREMTLPEALRVLSLTLPCTTEQVHAAYRRLVKERHPDTGGSTAAFQELQEACQECLRHCS
jgi:hypothetical protein